VGEQENVWEWRKAMADLTPEDRVELLTWLGMRHKQESEQMGKKKKSLQKKKKSLRAHVFPTI